MEQIIFEEIGDPQCVEVIQFEELGTQGIPGESAYQYAIRTGMFVGTEVEFYSKTIDEPIAAAIVATNAAQLATQAAQNVGSAITDATNAATLANEKAILADNAAQYADDAAQLANQEAASATAAALAANNSATATDAAKDAANLAATNANDKAALANSASQSANTAAALANTAVTNANTARDSANTAAANANTKAGEASAAAAAANAAAVSASQFQNKQSQFFSPKQLIAWDNFDRADVNPIVKAESGHLYAAWKGTNKGMISGKLYQSNSSITYQESAALVTIAPTKNIGIEFSMDRATLGHSATGIAIIKNDLNYFFFGRISFSYPGGLFPEISASHSHQLISVVAGVATVLGTFSRDAIFGGGVSDSYQDTRMSFVVRFLNRGRSAASGILVQSLDKPTERIEVVTTTLNSVFASPTDYNKIAIIGSNAARIHHYNIADLNL